MRKSKLGMSAIMILGIIYAVLGGMFVVGGIIFLLSGVGALSIVGLSFTSVGGFFLILGIAFLLIRRRKKKRADAMLEAGRYVWAEVVDCVPNYAVRINSRHPYILIAKYTDMWGMEHVFRSANLRIFRDPSLIGKHVKVYYDTEDFRHYYVDAEPILPNYIEH